MKRIVALLLGMIMIFLALPVIALADTVEVTGSGVNVRTGPGTSYQSLGKLSKGAKLERIAQEAGWSQVTYNGERAYISSRYVKAVEQARVEEQSYVTARYNIYVYEKASASSKALVVAKKGAALQKLGESGKYTKVLVNAETTGYVYTPYVSPAQTVEANQAPTATEGSFLTELAQEAIDLTNQVRKKNGVQTLKVSEALTVAAQIRCNEIVKKFSHTRPDGSQPNTVDAKILGENIARADSGLFLTAKSIIVEDGFMTSSAHKKNMLSKNYKTIGMAGQTVNGMTYWVQLFGA